MEDYMKFSQREIRKILRSDDKDFEEYLKTEGWTNKMIEEAKKAPANIFSGLLKKWKTFLLVLFLIGITWSEVYLIKQCSLENSEDVKTFVEEINKPISEIGENE
jgi:hypothetical protein